MIINETKLNGVLSITPDRFEDHRGSYMELYDSKKFEQATNVQFVQDDISISNKGVLRGWQSFTLSRQNKQMLLLPPGVGNSILALEDNLIYYYKQNTHFTDGQQFTIKWDDPKIGIDWPINNPILQKRDR